MNLRYITCNGPKENTKLADMVDLAKINPNTEFAIPASSEKMGFGKSGHNWFDKLLAEISGSYANINLAMHLKYELADSFCRGAFPYEIVNWFYAVRQDGKPIIRRWQLNLDDVSLFNVKSVNTLLKLYPDREFIFQYSPKHRGRIQKLYDAGARFSVLYDADYIKEPLFKDCPQGYTCNDENMKKYLAQVRHVASRRDDIWIDNAAGFQGKQVSAFDIERARQFIMSATKTK